MERPEINLGGPQNELKLREPWYGMGRKGPLRNQKGLGQIHTPPRVLGLNGGHEGLGGIQSKLGHPSPNNPPKKN